MIDILIDVVITTHNSSNYIDYSINSVLEQTHKNLNIIIVDDGSTDNTVELIKSIPDSRINLHCQSNNGVSNALNNALKYLIGEYVFFLDHDDFIPKNYFEIMLKHLSNESFDCIISGRKQLFNYSNYYKLLESHPVSDKRIVLRDKFDILSPLFRHAGYSFHITDKLFKSAVYEEFSFNELITASDLDSCYKLLDKCDNVLYIPNLLFFPVSTSKFSLSKQNQTIKYWTMINDIILEMQRYFSFSIKLREMVDDCYRRTYLVNSLKLLINNYGRINGLKLEYLEKVVVHNLLEKVLLSLIMVLNTEKKDFVTIMLKSTLILILRFLFNLLRFFNTLMKIHKMIISSNKILSFGKQL